MADHETKEPLLKKVYVGNCPGCELDRKKDANPGLPYKEFFFVWILTLAGGKLYFIPPCIDKEAEMHYHCVVGVVVVVVVIVSRLTQLGTLF